MPKLLLVKNFDTVKEVAGKVFSAIGDIAKKAINGILGGIESFINGVINGFNFMIKALNTYSPPHLVFLISILSDFWVEGNYTFIVTLQSALFFINRGIYV